ncbi:type II secretion system protein [bacterium]|nr:type II secretion system protein [bacterium]
MITEDQRARRQEGKQVNPSPQPSPTRGEGVNSRVDFSLPLITGLPRSLRSLAMTKPAFTLAEVLITLGIIGIVAAMTLPALIQNHRNQVAETRLKKFYSAINQAIIASEAVNGDRTEWHSSSVYDVPESGRNEQAKVWFDTYLKPYIKVIDEGYSSDNRFIVYFSDGSALKFLNDDCLRDFLFYIGNPEKCDNKISNPYGRCKFAFLYAPGYSDHSYWSYSGRNFEPYKYLWNGNITSLYTGEGVYTSTACNSSGDGRYCSAIIQYNNWKIPKDYPRKILY